MRLSILTPLLLIVLSVAFRAELRAQETPGAIVVSEAVYSGTLSGARVSATATIKVEMLEDSVAEIRLFPAGTPVTEPKLPSKGVHFLRDADGTKILIDAKGSYTIAVPFSLDVIADGPATRCVWPLLDAASVRGTLVIPKGGLEAAVAGDGDIRASEAKGGTTIEFFPRSGPTLTLVWAPKGTGLALGAPLDVEAQTFASLEAGLLRVSTAIRATAQRGGETDHLSVRLPAGAAVTQVAGGSIDRWSAASAADGVRVDLWFRRPAPAILGARLKYEVLLGALPVEVSIAPPLVSPAGRQVGLLGIGVSGVLEAREARTAGFEKIDVGSVDFEVRPSGVFPTLAYRYAGVAAADGAPVAIGLALDEKPAPLVGEVWTFVTLENGLATAHVLLRPTFEGAGRNRLACSLPAGYTLNSVRGDKVADWKAEPDRLSISLTRRRVGLTEIFLEFQTIADPEKPVPIPAVRLLEASRQTGLLALGIDDRHEFMVDSTTGLRQIEPSELPPRFLEIGRPKIAFAATTAEWALATRIGPLAPEVRAALATVITLTPEQAFAVTRIDLDVRRVGLFDLTCVMPPGFPPTHVLAENLRDWTYDSKSRELRLLLSRDLLGHGTVLIRAEADGPIGAPRIEMKGPEIRDAKEVSGGLIVEAPEDIEVRPVETEGLERVEWNDLAPLHRGPRAIGRPPVAAYEHRGPAWSIALTRTPIAPQIDVTVSNRIGCRPGLLSVGSFLRLDVSKAGTNRLTIALPKGAFNATIAANTDLARTEFRDGSWEVVMPRRVKGSILLRLGYEIALGTEGRFRFEPEKVAGANLANGYVILAQDRSDTEVGALDPAGLTSIASHEVPAEFAGAVGAAATHLFRWRETGAVTVSASEHARDLSTLGAKVSEARIDTIVRADGEVMHDLSTMIENSMKQSLSVGLPKDAVIWGTYVWGMPVKPSRQPDGKVLIPIRNVTLETKDAQVRAVLEGGYVLLRLVWVERLDRMGATGRLSLHAPALDVNVEQVKWNVHLPQGYHILSDSGTVKLVGMDGALVVPSVLPSVGASLDRFGKYAAGVVPWWWRKALLIAVRVALLVLVATLVGWVTWKTLRWLLYVSRPERAFEWRWWAFRAAPVTAVVFASVGLVLFKSVGVYKSAESRSLVYGTPSPQGHEPAGGYRVRDISQDQFPATITSVDGAVDIMRPGDSNWVPAQPGMELDQATQISTGPDATVLLSLQNGTEVEVGSLTQGEVAGFAVASIGPEQKRQTDIGSMKVEVRKGALKTDLKVRTPNSTASVSGSSAEVDYYPDSGVPAAADEPATVTDRLGKSLKGWVLGGEKRDHNEAAAEGKEAEGYAAYDPGVAHSGGALQGRAGGKAGTAQAPASRPDSERWRQTDTEGRGVYDAEPAADALVVMTEDGTTFRNKEETEVILKAQETRRAREALDRIEESKKAYAAEKENSLGMKQEDLSRLLEQAQQKQQAQNAPARKSMDKKPAAPPPPAPPALAEPPVAGAINDFPAPEISLAPPSEDDAGGIGGAAPDAVDQPMRSSSDLAGELADAKRDLAELRAQFDGRISESGAFSATVQGTRPAPQPPKETSPTSAPGDIAAELARTKREIAELEKQYVNQMKNLQKLQEEIKPGPTTGDLAGGGGGAVGSRIHAGERPSSTRPITISGDIGVVGLVRGDEQGGAGPIAGAAYAAGTGSSARPSGRAGDDPRGSAPVNLLAAGINSQSAAPTFNYSTGEMGRAEGALPIEVSLPPAGAGVAKFEAPYLGDQLGTIDLVCVSRGTTLMGQLFALIAIALAVRFAARRGRRWGLGTACLLVIAAVMAYGQVGYEYRPLAETGVVWSVIVLAGAALLMCRRAAKTARS
ncbi:MAG: hypothetical protein HYY93_13640 [Planctomycetes bacterium]|nr:hypothetical protein [Planctomycetota bacterium]